MITVEFSQMISRLIQYFFEIVAQIVLPDLVISAAFDANNPLSPYPPWATGSPFYCCLTMCNLKNVVKLGIP